MSFISTLTKTAALVLVGASMASAAVTTGEKAPDFSANTASGTEVKLSDYAGKTVVLEWTNKDCPFVKKFYNVDAMQKHQKAATEDGVVWLTVQSSAEGKQGHLDAEQSLKHKKSVGAAQTAIILDTDGTIGKMYAAKTTPHMFIVDGEGTLVYQGAIDSNSSADSNDIAGATNYVEVALASLKAGEPIEEATTQPYGCSVKY